MTTKLRTMALMFCLSAIVSRAQTDGALDMDFAPTGVSAVRAIKQLADGRVLISHSSFISGGVKAYTNQGLLDTLQFFPLPQQTEFSGNWIRDIQQQTDGKIIFINSVNQPKIVRYNLDGTVDSAYQQNIGTGANLTVRKGLLDNNNRLLLIGEFTEFNGVPKTGIVRLTSDGNIDTTFNITCANCILKDVCYNESGGYFLGGLINVINNQGAFTETAKIKSNGDLDTTFRTNLGSLDAIAMQPNGQLIGLQGAEAGNGAPKNIVRFSLDGLVDSVLGLYTGNNVIELYIQADGKLILTGGFTGYQQFNTTANIPVNGIFRLNTDGSFDAAFNPGSGPDNALSCSGFNADGSILLGGLFGQFDGEQRTYMARLNNAGIPFNILSSSPVFSSDSHFNNITVYPNPFSSQLFWESDKAIQSARLIDFTGRSTELHLSGGLNSSSVPNLSSGVYFLKLTHTDGSTHTQKLIHIH